MLSISLLGWGVMGAVAAENTNGLMRALGDRIMECQVPASGVLLLEPLSRKPGGLVPYFSHFAAYGLLRAYEATREPRYLEAADRWIDWYRTQQRADGTVTDYKFDPMGTLVSTGTMDSTDSYAAMYLWIVAERWRVAKEPASWLADHELSCVRALSAILLTMQDSGLTFAKPDYPVEYLMDNAEVIVGLRSGGLIFEALGNTGLAAWTRKLAERADKELRTFYDPARGYYAWYRDQQGQLGSALDKWYPDVMAQVLFLMRVGRAEEPDQGVFTRVAARHLAPGFDAQKPAEHLWWGLAAQRVGDREWIEKLIPPLANLSADETKTFDAVRCSLALEALTGGTQP